MKLALFELRLMLHSRLARAALLLFFGLGLLSAWAGLQAVATQQAALVRIAAGQQAELDAIVAKNRDGGEAGMLAYGTPHLTTNPPSTLAFAAFGQRDMQPYSLRVRLLGLQAQLYESEQNNPELVMPGRFDFAFVLVYLAPLFIIALMHDLVAGERESGRLRLLSSLPHAPAALWWRRIAVRFVVVLLTALLPLAAGMAFSGAGLGAFVVLGLSAACYLAFWFGLAAWVGPRAATAASSAATLLACLVTLTMILPTMTNAIISRMVPVSRGIELALGQRQAVHEGWDLPRAVTMQRFFQSHPEWQNTSPVTGRFHWKWYYAMHQVGDDAVAAQVASYRSSMQERETWTRRAAWFQPSVAMQLVLHRMAQTDLQSQLDYQRKIEAFHTALRHYYYPFIFNERPFGAAQFARTPQFQHVPATSDFPMTTFVALALLSMLMLAAGLRQAAGAEERR